METEEKQVRTSTVAKPERYVPPHDLEYTDEGLAIIKDHPMHSSAKERLKWKKETARKLLTEKVQVTWKGKTCLVNRDPAVVKKALGVSWVHLEQWGVYCHPSLIKVDPASLGIGITNL